MPNNPAPPYCRVEVDCVIGADVFTKSRFYYSLSTGSPLAPGIAQAAINAWSAAVTPVIAAFMAADCEVVSAKIAVHTLTELQEAHVSAATPGTVAGDSLPAQDCAVITWQYPTPLVGGRVSRGRSFFSGIPEGGADSGFLGSGQVTAVQNIATAILAPLSVAGVSETLQIWLPAHNTWGVVSDLSVDPVIKTLRRRRPGS